MRGERRHPCLTPVPTVKGGGSGGGVVVVDCMAGCVFMQALDQMHYLHRDAIVPEDLPDDDSVHHVESFIEVHNADVEGLLPFQRLLDDNAQCCNLVRA